MHSLRYSVRRWAAQHMDTQPSHACKHVGTATLIGVIVLLTGATQLYAEGRKATASLSLRVRPEELLQDQNGSVALKIRLAHGTIARLWAATSCTSPPRQSHVISMSGIYSFPHSALAPVISEPNPNSLRICLASSDGLLNDSLPVANFGIGGGTAVQRTTPLTAPSGASMDLPAVLVVTTQAAITTTSRP